MKKGKKKVVGEEGGGRWRRLIECFRFTSWIFYSTHLQHFSICLRKSTPAQRTGRVNFGDFQSFSLVSCLHAENTHQPSEENPTKSTRWFLGTFSATSISQFEGEIKMLSNGNKYPLIKNSGALINFENFAGCEEWEWFEIYWFFLFLMGSTITTTTMLRHSTSSSSFQSLTPPVESLLTAVIIQSVGRWFFLLLPPPSRRYHRRLKWSERKLIRRWIFQFERIFNLPMEFTFIRHFNTVEVGGDIETILWTFSFV